MWNTTHFVEEIENVNNIIDYSYLVSLDVQFLFTNIPYTEANQAVRKSPKI